MVRRWYADGGDRRFRFDYELGRSSLVLDLGGYEGQWASDLYSRHRCRIVVFEPVSAFADAIRERFENNHDITVEELALGASSRMDTIHVCGASSSAYKKKSESQQIRYVDVHDWFEEHGIKNVALMKINIEGGEFELLERMLETELARRVDDIQVQFHNIADESEQRMTAIQLGLGRTHELTYQYRFVWENWKRRDA